MACKVNINPTAVGVPDIGGPQLPTLRIDFRSEASIILLGADMLITVKYRDGKIGMVKSSLLDELIKKKKISHFMRAEGWVKVEDDPIRERESQFKGSERRRN